MNAISTKINGTSYDLATTLRVAYEVQGKHNHESYMKIFRRIGEMTLEEQIDIIYVAFKIANKEIAKTFSDVMFREYYLDNYTVSDITDQLNHIVAGILGKDLDELKDEADAEEGNA